MKVLHAITGLSVGGAENMLAKLIEEASTRQSAYDPSVLSLMTPGDISQRILNCRVPIDTLGMHQGLPGRSEEHTSELQSLMRISYAVFCLTKKNINQTRHKN